MLNRIGDGDRGVASLERVEEIARLRRQAALDLYAVCAAFVTALNGFLSKTRVMLDPPVYSSDNFAKDCVNLLPVNPRGRLLLVAFTSTPALFPTE